MNPSIQEQLHELWNEAISRPTMRFDEALPRLYHLGVERYHADFAGKVIDEGTSCPIFPFLCDGRCVFCFYSGRFFLLEFSL